MTCSREWQAQAIDDARLGEADVAAFERHVGTCTTCRAAQARLAELRALARQLPAPVPSELQMRRLRARILGDAMARSARTPRRGALLLATAAAALVLLVCGVAVRRLSPAAFAGNVQSDAGAAWTQVRHGGVERVVLSDGDIVLRVRKQEDDERFLVIVPDGEVEVRGTTFEVAVHDGRTTRVHVDEGVVIVRVHGSTTLVAGDGWPNAEVRSDAPSVAAAPPPTPAILSTPASVLAAASANADEPAPAAVSLGRAARPSVPPAPTAASSVSSRRDDAEGLHDYERSIEAYRGAHFEEAAELFRAFAVTHPSSSLLDDASFLEASSLASAGRNDAAALLAERHLARFPSSFHRKEAAILVARLRRDRGDCDGARRVAAPWVTESPPDSRIRAALGGCAGD